MSSEIQHRKSYVLVFRPLLTCWFSSLYKASDKVLFMPPPFEEWWKGHLVLCLSIHPSMSAFGISNLSLSFSCPLDVFLVKPKIVDIFLISQ